MTIRQTILAAAFALAAIGPAHAEGLKPLQGQVIDLGDVSGVVYYTLERDGEYAGLVTEAKVHERARNTGSQDGMINHERADQ